jgi:hypothetical protein
MALEPDDYYLEDGLMVLTERFHLKRGSCCGNACRHCPYDHLAVPEASQCARRAALDSSPPAGSIENSEGFFRRQERP